jgi:hypothetical protein
MSATPSAVAAVIETVRVILSRTATGTTVVVCPDDGLHIRTFRRYTPVLLPEGATRSGHTVTRPDGSRVTFLGCSDLDAAPSGVPFVVEFIGWGTDVMSDANLIKRWIDLAASAQ